MVSAIRKHLRKKTKKGKISLLKGKLKEKNKGVIALITSLIALLIGSGYIYNSNLKHLFFIGGKKKKTYKK